MLRLVAGDDSMTTRVVVGSSYKSQYNAAFDDPSSRLGNKIYLAVDGTESSDLRDPSGRLHQWPTLYWGSLVKRDATDT